MSTLKVNKIRDTSGSADAITLDPSGGAVLAGVTTISTARITTGITTSIQVGGGVTISESGIEASGIGITCANINGGQIGGRRNIIINGAMNVAQRGTSSTSSGFYTVDRVRSEFTGTDEAPTQAQVDVTSGTSPYTEGFRKALKITNGNQTSGAGAADFVRIRTNHEGSNLATSGWNYTSSSSFITVQFWVRSSVAQTYQAYVRSMATTSQVYVWEFALSANTWTKVIKTIPGNSNIVFDNNNQNGLELSILAFMGTDYTTASPTLNAWGAFSGGDSRKDMTSTWYTTNDATFELTGLQLEVGSQATPFEHRSYQEELHLCKRYYQRYPEGPTADNYNCVPSAIMACNNTTTAYYCPTLNPTMRSSPSFSTSGNFRMNGTASVNNVAVTAIGVYHNGASTPFQYASVASGLTAGQAVALSVNNDATAYIEYDAEL
jgi:hypothetical protein